MDAVQSFIDGLMFGAVYALIGLGFTLVFGVTNKLNLAYGASSIGGVYLGVVAYKFLAAPALVVFLISVAGAGLSGLLVYLACFRFTARCTPLSALVATVGMFLFIDALIGELTAEQPELYPDMTDLGMWQLGALSVRAELVLVLVLSVISMIVLWRLLYRSRLGLAMRAVSQGPLVAQLCGIRVERTSAATFAITGLLGGVAGAMVGMSVGVLSPLLLIPITVKGLIVTVVGGLGSLRGAIVAGLLVGALENLSLHFRGVLERDLYVMLLLFLFLALRPRGIFGRGHQQGTEVGPTAQTSYTKGD